MFITWLHDRGVVSFMSIPCSKDRKRFDSVFYFLVLSDQSPGFSSESISENRIIVISVTFFYIKNTSFERIQI